MADKTINDLTATTSLADGDIFELENTGNNSRKITFANLRTALFATGTWTPVVAFGGASVGVTYGTQVGRYIKIGTLVVATARIVLTNKGSSTGSFTITGLPFTARNVSNYTQGAAGWGLGTPTGKTFFFYVNPNTTILNAIDVTNNATADNSDVVNTSEFIVTLTYECEP